MQSIQFFRQKMENTIFNSKKDCQKRIDLLQFLGEEIESTEDNSLSERLVIRKVKPKHVPILTVKSPQTSENCSDKLFLQGNCGLENKIPKHIMSIDEKYLRRCLELIHISARREGVLSDRLSSRKKNSSRSTCEYPMAVETESIVISSNENWILGSVTRSKSMINILKSPLFHKLGALDSDIKEPMICSDFTSSPTGLSTYSSQKPQKEIVVLGDHIYGLDPLPKRLVSVSSTNSICSDQSSSSSSSSSASVSQGMLQCTWKDGLPRYVFSIDGHREVYVANLFKVESSDDKVLDYMYMFHSSVGWKKEREISENESDLVGKMRVSTCFTLCPNNVEIMETQFVLFGSNENCVGETQTSSRTRRKTKGLSKKVVDAFRTSHSSKHRTKPSVIPESCAWEPNQVFGKANLSENHPPTNLELAAIIVKDHNIRDNVKDAGIGGWGLKFLKKVGIIQNNASVEAAIPECCLRNTGDCSTSMEIILPAGFHGGPRTRNDGPSSLIERWNSGGCCDCGGWDIGCPLTALNARPTRNDGSAEPDMPGNCMTFDIFIQGSKQGGSPIMNMVNVHDGLYYIHFQSTLSALQSFSIAAAIIHTYSPTLRPKVNRR